MRVQNLLSSVYLPNFLFQAVFILFVIGPSFSLHAQCFETVIFENPGESTFTIPSESANYIIEIEARGADGGDFVWGTLPPSEGGQGATLKASFLVPGASDLIVFLGGSGFDGSGKAAGGGGGGSAVILDNAEVLIAAAGGGGAGLSSVGEGGLANTDSPAIGGQGSTGAGGGGFGQSGMDGLLSTGGGEGNITNIGVGGFGGGDAGSGGVGFGGGGGGSNDSGGGGGGYKGGSGGDTDNYEGEGGDSYVTDLFSGSVILATPGEDGEGFNEDGYVSISCIPVTLVELELTNFSHPLCFDGFDGNIEVTATNGLAPYMYSLNGGVFGTDNVFSGLPSGDYNITVKDGLGNMSMVSVTLINPPILTNTFIESTDNTCFGAFEGTIEVIGSGGTSAAGYSYSLNGGDVQPSGLFSGLSNGFYVVTVFDDNLCSSQITTNITSPSDILVTVTDIEGVTCPGDSDGSASVFVMGGVPGYSYALDTMEFDVFSSFSSLSPGLHTISVMDSDGCVEIASFNVSEPDAIDITSEVEQITCSGYSTGIIDVNVSGGSPAYVYSFNGMEEDTIGIYEDLSAGEYNIVVTDQNGCTASAVIEITEPDSLELVVVSNSPASCGGNGEVVLDLVDVEGLVLYSVDGVVGSSDTFNLPAGIYLGTACDSLGCAASLQFEVLQLSDISIALGSKSDVTCYGGSDGSITVTSSGGEGEAIYNIDGEPGTVSSTFDSLSSGNYIITATDSIGCSASLLVTIDEAEELSVEVISITDVTCFGDNSGAVNIEIQGGSGPHEIMSTSGVVTQDSFYVSINDLTGGEVILSIFDSLGCMIMDTVSIAQNPPLQLSIDSVASVNCAEGNMGYVALSATGGVPSYSFSLGSLTNDGIFDQLMADNYTFSVEDSVGCITGTEVNIGMLGALIIEGTGSSDVSCFGGNDGLYVLNIPNFIGGIDWRIDGQSNPDSNFTDLSAGQYTLTATDSFLCAIEIAIDINEPDELRGDVINFYGGTGNNDGEITILAEGGTEPYQFFINGLLEFQNTGHFVGLVEGDYVFTIIDANGCEVIVEHSLVDIIDPVFNGLKISPNPAQNSLVIDVDSAVDGFSFSIMDVNGRMLNSVLVDYNKDSATLDIQELHQGPYFIKITNGKNFVVRRFIKI